MNCEAHFCFFIAPSILSTSVIYLSANFWNYRTRTTEAIQRISHPHKTPNQRSTRAQTYLLLFYRVFPKLALLHARLVVFTELDAGTLGFALSDRL